MVGVNGLSGQSSCCARLDVLRGGRDLIVPLSSITSLGSMRIVVVLPAPYSSRDREFVLRLQQTKGSGAIPFPPLLGKLG
jgi:hypothetical protein